MSSQRKPMLAPGPNPVLAPASTSATPRQAGAHPVERRAGAEPLSTTTMRGTRLWARKRSTVASTATGLSRCTMTRSTAGWAHGPILAGRAGWAPAWPTCRGSGGAGLVWARGAALGRPSVTVPATGLDAARRLLGLRRLALAVPHACHRGGAAGRGRVSRASGRGRGVARQAGPLVHRARRHARRGPRRRATSPTRASASWAPTPTAPTRASSPSPTWCGRRAVGGRGLRGRAAHQLARPRPGPVGTRRCAATARAPWSACSGPTVRCAPSPARHPPSTATSAPPASSSTRSTTDSRSGASPRRRRPLPRRHRDRRPGRLRGPRAGGRRRRRAGLGPDAARLAPVRWSVAMTS